MDCTEARAGLWPPEQPRLVGDEVAAARLHVEGCDDCREYFEQDRALLDWYDRVRRHPAPGSGPHSGGGRRRHVGSLVVERVARHDRQ